MKLSVVIVNYNVKHFLEQCLRSVEKASAVLDVETFVVDNNSVDGSMDMVNALFPNVKSIINHENVGFSKANNQAIRISKGEYVLLLNPDTIVPENCFKDVINFMDTTPLAGACGVKMVDGQGNFLPESKRGLPTPEVALYKMIGLNKVFPKSKKFGKYHLGYLPENETNEVEILAGAFMFMRKTALDKVGLLDETFFMYGEDIDLSYRIIKGGYKNYYFADTSLIHYKGESTKKLSVNYVKVFYKAMVIFAEKHYKGRNKRSFKFLINSAIYARAAVTLAVNFIKKFWLPIFEIVLIFISMYWLKGYWEEHIKRDNEVYPPEMLTIHIPYYTLSWVVSLWFIGSYKSRYDFGKLVRGILVGTAIISIVYGLLPDSLRFSRGIILFGTVVVLTVLLVWRSLFHFIKYKTFDFSQRNSTKSILVGSATKWGKVTNLLKSYDKNYQQIGFVTHQKEDHKNWLGTTAQLNEIVSIYGINEIIFSSESISTEQTLEWMNKIGPEVNYFTIPANSDFVIGSQSKNANGLYFGEQIELNLSKQEYKQQKRLLDIVLAFISLVLYPLFILFKKTKKLSKNALNVLKGSKSYVGYSADDHESLPVLRPGVFTTDFMLKSENVLFQENLDKLYAKNYSVSLDLRIIFG